MSKSCTVDAISPVADLQSTVATVDAPEVLLEIVRRFVTPTYAYDISRIHTQVAKLRTHLPPEVEILYSLKANASLSLPGDVLAEARLMPPLVPGDLLAFPNAGAYGLAASPWLFHSHPAPAEVAFEGTCVQPLRPRRPPESVLEGQALLQESDRKADA